MARDFLRQAFGATARLLHAVFRPQPSEDSKARVYWNDGVALTIQNLVHEAETRASGRVQVLTLAEFRADIPDLWDKYKDRILIIAESTIARTIGRGNTFIPQGDDAWLLLFPAVTEEEAQTRTDAMAAKIGEKLMGARFSPTDPPMPTTARLDLGDALRADGSLDPAVIQAAVQKARQAQSGATAKPAIARPSPKAARSRPQLAPPTPAAAFTVAVSYRPAWSANTQSIDTFSLRALNDFGVNVFDESAPALNQATMVELVRTGAAIFRTMCNSGLRAKFTIPIQFSALETPALAEIQQLISSLDQQARLVQLRIELTRISPHTTIDRLVAARELFRPFVREVAFSVDPFLLQDYAFALEHIVLSADIAGQYSRSDTDFFQGMLALRQRANRRTVHVTGLQSPKQVAGAINAGIDEVSGPAVQADVKVLPRSVTVISHHDLLSS